MFDARQYRNLESIQYKNKNKKIKFLNLIQNFIATIQQINKLDFYIFHQWQGWKVNA